MKLQNLYNQAKSNYENYLQCGVSSFKEKALNYYKQYKALGGKKIIKGLEGE